MTLRGEALVLFQNLQNPTYREVMFGGRDLAEVFGEERARMPRGRKLSGRQITTLIEKGVELLVKGQLAESPYGVAV